MAADVVELVVGRTWKNLAAVATKEFNGSFVFRFHDWSKSSSLMEQVEAEAK
ncbi:uncharacterized protein G2W53_018896 [Senna tora]|uniref:Uncharacterized protein n=1 Tax=Senna tora TaxID=362788 RepID=A0A834TT70_9FABA|nr:uncharacterized protein G2W53_018896 [Senna tora]